MGGEGGGRSGWWWVCAMEQGESGGWGQGKRWPARGLGRQWGGAELGLLEEEGAGRLCTRE